MRASVAKPLAYIRFIGFHGWWKLHDLVSSHPNILTLKIGRNLNKIFKIHDRQKPFVSEGNLKSLNTCCTSRHTVIILTQLYIEASWEHNISKVVWMSFNPISQHYTNTSFHKYIGSIRMCHEVCLFLEWQLHNINKASKIPPPLAATR